MAFGPETNAAASNTKSSKDFEPAIGFINLYLPSADGGRAKLGKGIPLVASNKRENALAQALLDPARKDEVIAALMQHLTIDFQSAEQSDAKAFKLGDLVL